jgi:hypothetical protein
MFVDRSTLDGEETVVLRYAAAFYWLMWPTLAMTVWASLHSTTATNVAAGLAWLLLLGVAIPYWPIIFKLKRQMRDGAIVASGSKYSFSNPLTYRWPSADGSERDS